MESLRSANDKIERIFVQPGYSSQRGCNLIATCTVGELDIHLACQAHQDFIGRHAARIANF